MKLSSIAVIGGGLAGSECALALANAGIAVTLFDQKPNQLSPAHTSSSFAELVCSNSFRSDGLDSAIGLLKQEMRQLGSICMEIAEKTRVPAGKALAVDRTLFASMITQRIMEHPGITVVHQEITDLDTVTNPALAHFDCIVVSAGPLASPALTASLQQYTGDNHLYFFDAIAPVIDGATVNMDIAFWGSRYQPEDTDYLNCPMTKDEYFAFHQALLEGVKVTPHAFEKEIHFEGCMPIEALAERGPMTLAFGPFKPVGFIDPRTGERPFAIVQLRTENTNKTMFNLVGCQTKLTFAEQARIFRLIPGLEHVEFVRFGSMHRNTFVNAPKVLRPDLSLITAPHIYLAGQITGVEGYVESAATGLWLAKLLIAKANGTTLTPPPQDTALGSLLHFLHVPAKHFQPSNVQFGLMPELTVRAKKNDRKLLYSERAISSFGNWLSAQT